MKFRVGDTVRVKSKKAIIETMSARRRVIDSPSFVLGRDLQGVAFIRPMEKYCGKLGKVVQTSSERLQGYQLRFGGEGNSGFSWTDEMLIRSRIKLEE